MNRKREPIYMPKERKSILLRVCGIIFCAGTLFMLIFGEDMGIERGDILILAGIAVLLATLSINGARAERKNRDYSETIKKIREETGKGDYNSDIYFKDK